MKPLVTVITPAYNRAATIARAVESVLSQDFANFEFLIVDDGSTDGTLQCLISYSDARLQVISQPNAGAAAARNAGVLAARGQFIAFLDSDDEWLPHKLSRQMNLLVQHEGEIKACLCDFYENFPDRPDRVVKINQPDDWFKRLLMGCKLGPGTNLVVSRDAFHVVGLFDPLFKRYEDWDWLLRYTFLQYPLLVVNEPLSRVYRYYKTVDLKQEQSARRLIRKHFHYALRYGRAFSDRAHTHIWLNIADKYINEGNLKRAAYLLLLTALRYPFQISRRHAYILIKIILAKVSKLAGKAPAGRHPSTPSGST